jgi:hypothetical protein
MKIQKQMVVVNRIILINNVTNKIAELRSVIADFFYDFKK